MNPIENTQNSFNLKFSDRDYHAITEFVYKTAGINLLEGKKELVRTRLGKRMRQLQMTDFSTYFKHVMNDTTGEEIIFLLDALATNLTSFFREDQHFTFMANTMLPALEAKCRAKGNRRLRIWSAACSSGEEPYTIGMVILEKNPYFGQGADCKILATDISTKVLSMAQKGIYGPERMKTVPPMLVTKYFQKVSAEKGHAMYQVNSQLRSLIAFRRLNLMDPLPFKNPLDLIFCRNVMIYFDKATIGRLVNKYYQILAPGGYLFIGHSESLSGLTHDFKYVKPCIYQKAE
jgi:chemotaxis protein methyltransferase CheR